MTSHAEVSELNQLVDYVIGTNFSQLVADIPDREDRIIAFFAQVSLHYRSTPLQCTYCLKGLLVFSLNIKVVEETAQLIAKWMSVGFVHGVMNTDNLRYHTHKV